MALPGWNYKHWIGTFYPEGTSHARELPYFTEHFNTVEINNSFYRMPRKEVFERWREETPLNFLFAVKASRYITHMKKLKDVGQSIDWLLDNASGLGRKLGPILFQLPPKWKLNVGRLEGISKNASEGSAFFFRVQERHMVQ